MMNENPEMETSVVLSCPGCGHPLSMQTDATSSLACPTGHSYTLETLLIGQSIRAESLLQAAIRFLEQQESLVRGLARQMWQSQSVSALKLEGQADRIGETIGQLKAILQEKREPVALRSGTRPSSQN
jgi:hypothetical protein